MYNDYYHSDNYLYPYLTNQFQYRSPFTGQFNNSHNSFNNQLDNGSNFDVRKTGSIRLKDYGNQPLAVDIDELTEQNNNFRTALWTGNHLQVTLMNINIGDDIGLEIHTDTDQFLKVEEGEGLVRMGNNRDTVDFQARISDDSAIVVPSGTWHNIINTGNKPLKLYSIYSPPEHPFGTVHRTKAEAQASERNSYY